MLSVERKRGWYSITGIEPGTGYEFDGTEDYWITDDDQVLNSDGWPMTEGDNQTVAVRNAVEKLNKV